jgi:excisionase family DNA binding protein
MSATKMEPIAVSITDAGRLLGAHRNTIGRLIAKGVLTPVVLPGGLKRIPVADIKALVEHPPADVRVARRKRGAL